ncbi:TIM44-like domain-containing protein [Zavarzinella formosa]|uniref:TIM44-like domain-containing protein n=1 Tax=Zavarzinella formosa TaxID=360055 RepID=UPI00036541C3|nr:TIM44-like domain-containing protein [Zavarzinella formosa]
MNPSSLILFADAYTSGYIFGYVAGSSCFFLISIFVLRAVWRSMFGERNARRVTVDPADILDDTEKKPEILYKTEKVPEWKVAHREKATRKLLKFMAARDKWLERKYLCEMFEEAYLLVREAMERRSVERIEKYLTEEHADELHANLKALKKKGRRRIFGRVEITDIEILQIETAGPKSKQTVTAMITVKSKDYIESDESGKVVEGTKKTYYFQEFWTFRRGEKRWLVELIRPSADVDSVMESKNVISKSDYEDLKAETGADVLEHVSGR